MITIGGYDSYLAHPLRHDTLMRAPQAMTVRSNALSAIPVAILTEWPVCTAMLHAYIYCARATRA